MIEPSLQAKMATGIFLVFYVTFLLRKMFKGQIDIYDFFSLSMIAIIPSIFVFISRIGFFISDLIGVKFPFVIMFSLLLVIIFVFIHRLTIISHQLQKQNRKLIQEMGLLNYECHSLKILNGLNETGPE